MLDDFGGPSSGGSRKPKRIEPLVKPPKKSIVELAAEQEDSEHTAAGQNQPSALNEAKLPGVRPEQANSADAPLSPTTENVFSRDRSDTAQRAGFFAWRWTIARKWTLLAAALLVLIVGGLAFAYFQQPSVKGGVHVSKRPPKPALVQKDPRVPSTLTGLLVDPTVNQQPVTGVMIENSLDARPQSGLDQAGVVFEAIAEGGITRFMALYQDTQPDYLGPVRSARPYYVQWCMSFDCALAHAGGSPEALQNIGAWGTKDLNDAVGYFWRISSRYAPHNLYSSIPKLHEYEASRGYGPPTFTGLTRKKDQPHKVPAAGKPAADPRPVAKSINLTISSASFNAHFDYDAATNSYVRSQGGAPHMVVDGAGTQTQLRPKVVVALIMAYGIAPDGHSQYGVTGSGQAKIFQDGVVTDATWQKADTTAPLRLTDAAGKDVPLNAGQTWLTALSSPGQATYQ